MAAEYNATVSQRVELAPGLIILRVVPDRLPFEFKSGQYVVLGLRASEPRIDEADPDRMSYAPEVKAPEVEAPEEGTANPAAAEEAGAVAAASAAVSANRDGAEAPGGVTATPGAAETGPETRAQQAVTTRRLDPDKLIRRAYSIASGSRSEEFLEFYITVVMSGDLTPRLFRLQIKDRIYVGPKAVGMFTLEKAPHDHHVLMVATGTGLAPYMSMLRSDLECGGERRFMVVHGARCSWDLGFRTELTTLARHCPNLTYLPVITRPYEDPTWRGRTGYLQEILFSGVIEETTGLTLTPDNFHVYLCGNPGMIETVLARLSERGFVRDRGHEIGSLHTEEYW